MKTRQATASTAELGDLLQRAEDIARLAADAGEASASEPPEGNAEGNCRGERAGDAERHDQGERAEPQGDPRRGGGDGADAGRQAVAAGGRHAAHEGRQQAASGGMRGRERQQHQPGGGERGHRARPEQEREGKRQRTIGADPAVAHDLQAPLGRGAAAEAVGGVGEPVLVQRAGGQHADPDGGQRGRGGRKAGTRQQGVGRRGRDADRRAGQRGRPLCGGKGPSGAVRDRQRKPRVEGEAEHDVLDDVARRGWHRQLRAMAWKKAPLTRPRRPPKAPSGRPSPSARSASGGSPPASVSRA